MELSKKDIGKLIRGAHYGSIQLKRRKYSCSKDKDILCNIIVNGLVEREYTCCCICKKLLKEGSSNKSCRNKHISRHYWKGDIVSPLIIDQLVDKFNLLRLRSLKQKFENASQCSE